MVLLHTYKITSSSNIGYPFMSSGLVWMQGTPQCNEPKSLLTCLINHESFTELPQPTVKLVWFRDPNTAAEQLPSVQGWKRRCSAQPDPSSLDLCQGGRQTQPAAQCACTFRITDHHPSSPKRWTEFTTLETSPTGLQWGCVASPLKL